MIGNRTRESLVSPRFAPELSTHRIILAGLTSARPGFRFIRVSPATSQVLACTAGEGLVLLQNHWVKCTPGTAYITPRGALHAYRAITAAPWELCWVTYRENASSPPMINLTSPALIETDSRPLSTSLAGLHREIAGQGTNADPAITHHWIELVQAYINRIIGPAAPAQRLRPVWEAVAADLARNWTVESLAEIAGISGEHLRRLCTAQFRHSPMHHVTHLRMQRATELLASTQRRVQDVALAVGYEDPFAFATAFKRHLKTTPSRYRAAATNPA